VILPVVIITIEGAQPDIDRDIESANLVWGTELEVWIDVLASRRVDRPELLVLTQTDCAATGHVVSDEEDELFDLGRSLGAEVIGYYVASDTGGFRGCAAHPPGRRGFWSGDSATQWTFIHEATHVVGDNPHISDSDNLMFVNGTASITNLPPNMNEIQRARILIDPALLSIESIVLNL
jgi:hypothetical protein